MPEEAHSISALIRMAADATEHMSEIERQAAEVGVASWARIIAQSDRPIDAFSFAAGELAALHEMKHKLMDLFGSQLTYAILGSQSLTLAVGCDQALKENAFADMTDEEIDDIRLQCELESYKRLGRA